MKKKPTQKEILKELSKKSVISTDSLKEALSYGENKEEQKKAQYALSRSIKQLVDAGFVESHDSVSQSFLRLTKSGKQKTNTLLLSQEDALVSTSWDGLWRIILLDVPEERKSEREALRYLLKKAGFVSVKNSVWVSLFPYEHLFENIKRDLELTTELIIIVTHMIDDTSKEAFFAQMNQTE
jgi:DNA-binding transcriptional regulator PaaX